MAEINSETISFRSFGGRNIQFSLSLDQEGIVRAVGNVDGILTPVGEGRSAEGAIHGAFGALYGRQAVRALDVQRRERESSPAIERRG